MHFIGKESNKLEEVEDQRISDAADVYTEYPDPHREASAWNDAVAYLKATTKSELREVEEGTGISFTTLKAWRRGRGSHVENRQRFLKWIASRRMATSTPR